ncbi:aspartyl-phosphate phosphatase Spo0E family protein [Halalkalibacter alkaliphilus]|uniref:Aspartyl-phosphate phosphatase Spo0E family protein n=1 Tax=Halalkalibacter alkaliphilus TaxID=2917993 RepID=A0A9X2I9V0_9BACI|nr:aspartyl-phosphate phosphatase Spo0E family protein [Halalkalibacter alkaliphilus]MCL7749664.1 aspartyl-phosphate phosphatase Spo0E family protein [Halalkalibacter alkaliphilus]
MTKDEQLLLQEIEKYRTLLNKKAKNTPLISDEMIYFSHKLDELLNKYQSLTSKTPIRH